jgi:hypothetical protein
MRSSDYAVGIFLSIPAAQLSQASNRGGFSVKLMHARTLVMEQVGKTLPEAVIREKGVVNLFHPHIGSMIRPSTAKKSAESIKVW